MKSIGGLRFRKRVKTRLKKKNTRDVLTISPKETTPSASRFELDIEVVVAHALVN